MNGLMKVTKVLQVEVDGLGAQIRAARKASGKTVKELAAASEMSTVHWFDIEGEKLRNSLPEDTLRRIEAVLGVDFGVSFD